ncbi:integrase arm-type DNA-binding domain-containing protein [Paracoccus sp. S4493]|uniref:tyrosine-type recombinase/integrase n=1 Tax=Paracoccus sp. S4493 TaxID=579490 RepID=UPI00138E0EBE|nr:integrase arm-type DNA-binding domain-containing protein [Paracoccus sp. S4493]
MALTAQQIRSEKPDPAGRIKKLSDGHGLQLHILPTGTLVWRLAYRWAGKQRSLTIGHYPSITLSEARLRAAKAREILRSGSDPSKPRSDEITFASLAESWSEKVREDGRSELTMIARSYQIRSLVDAIGSRPASSVTSVELLEHLTQISRKSRHSALRCRALAHQIYEYGVSTGRAVVNPAAGLSRALPAHRYRHHGSATCADGVRRILNAVESSSSGYDVKVAVQLAARIFLRSSELRRVTSDMIHFDQALIIVPAEIMKGGEKDHLVPLSSQVVQMLRGILEKRGPGLLIRGRDGRSIMSANTINKALRAAGMSHEDATLHGFRSSASTILHDAFPGESLVIEAQMAHADKDQVRGAYNRAAYLPRRRELMQHLSDSIE